MCDTFVGMLQLFLVFVGLLHCNGFKRQIQRSHQAHVVLSLKSSSVPVTSKGQMNQNAKNLVISGVSLLSFGSVTHARFFGSEAQNLVDDINALQKPVAELSDQLRPQNIPNSIGVYTSIQVLRGGPEDSNVVQGYVSTYIQPLQLKMEQAASKLRITDTAAQERLMILPSLMKGHIFELKQAIKEMSAANQLKEVDEVQETLAEFLKLASAQYEVTPYRPARILTDSELFGPFGCEFWGKKRIPGSNKCAEDSQ